jgi:hypothetical protein
MGANAHPLYPVPQQREIRCRRKKQRTPGHRARAERTKYVKRKNMNKSIITFICFGLLTPLLHGQVAFSNLRSFTITNFNRPCQWIPEIKYNPLISKLAFRIVTDNEDDYPYYYILRTKIEVPGENYDVYFDGGPSCDPGYILRLTSNPKGSAIRISGTQIIIPGNGNIYSSGHANTMFNVRRKYIKKGNDLVGIKQPYYSVDIKSAALQDITIYSSTNYIEPVAFIPKGTIAEVILEDNNHYLIRTEFGLLGWLKIDPWPQYPKYFKEIYFHGD